MPDAAPFEFRPLVADDDRDRAAYNAVFTSIWPEFAMTDAEFVHELAHSGPARRWSLVDPAYATVVGAAAVEHVRWNPDDAAPLAFVLLPTERATAPAYRRALAPCAAFATEGGGDTLRVLAWDRETVLRDLLADLPGWGEASREIDVGLDLQSATGWEHPPAAGIEVVTLAERPDLARAAHACLAAAIPDIPGDEPSTSVPFDEWLAERAAPSVRDDATFLAVDTTAGEGDLVVGFAGLEFYGLLEGVAWHGFTAVARAARGRGIARTLKAATIAYARDAGYRQLRTENEERNAPMRHINLTLGYAPVATRIVLRGPAAALLEP